MRNIFTVLAVLLSTHNIIAQDSLKADRPLIQIQAYPDTTKGYLYPNGMIADIQNGLWFSIYPLETSIDPKIQYFLKEKNGNAIIVKAPGNKHAFYVTPIKSKIEKLQKPTVELEFWALFNSKNVYYPTRKFPELNYRDKNGQLIEANILWKKYEDLTSDHGKLLIDTQKFLVKFE